MNNQKEAKLWMSIQVDILGSLEFFEIYTFLKEDSDPGHLLRDFLKDCLPESKKGEKIRPLYLYKRVHLVERFEEKNQELIYVLKRDERTIYIAVKKVLFHSLEEEKKHKHETTLKTMDSILKLCD